jgi:hypothetical protein
MTPASNGPDAPTPDASAGSGPAEKLTLREYGGFVAQLIGMCTFALAGPLFGVLQEGAAFFVAQGLTGASVVLFVVIWIIAPALAPMAVVGGLGLISATLARRAMAVLFGVFVALGVVGLIPGMTTWPVVVFVMAWAAGGVGLYLAYRRWSGLRQFATALVLAPLVFGAGFLISDQVRSVAFASESDSAVVASRDDNPVVFVVFDEFSLGAMLTPTGELNADLFPNFARLAQTSTWYPNATTGEPFTIYAMPSLLSGQRADQTRPPSAAAWPNTLFTAVGSPGAVNAYEFSTALCPSVLCPRPGADVGAVGRDSVTIMTNRVLPNAIASALVPPVADAWMSFGEAAGAAELADVSMQEFVDRWKAGLVDDVSPFNPRLIAGVFVAQLADLARGDLAYLHINLPHSPYFYLPDGTRYNGGDRPEWVDSQWLTLGSDPFGQISQRQRMLMQSMYADTVLGELLDQLDATGLTDETMVVVTSDHGVSLEPGGHRRAADISLTQNEADDVLGIPLFMKYPGQSVGVVDDRDARLVDVVPTVVDALNVDLDPAVWSFDGVSLLGQPVEGRPRWFGGTPDIGIEPSALMSAARLWFALGQRAMAGDVFAIGPHADLVGQRVDDVRRGVALGAILDPNDPELVSDVDITSYFKPLLVAGGVAGLESGTWLAASLNGTVVGLGPVFQSVDGRLAFEVMMQPDPLVGGFNTLELHVVDEKTGLLRSVL